MITSPMGIRDLLMANRREHMIEAPTFFFIWDMDEITADDGVTTEHMIIITDILITLDPETFIPTTTLDTKEWVQESTGAQGDLTLYPG